MTTMLERREAATGVRKRSQSNLSLIEQKRLVEAATKKTAGLASRAFERSLGAELQKMTKRK